MGWRGHVIYAGPEVEATAAYGRATAIAKTIPAHEGETRTLDQIRADVMADLLIEGTTTAHPTEARGIRATVVVTVPALALLESDRRGGCREGSRPCDSGRCRTDPDRPGARTVRRRRDVDAGAHASRDGRGALGRTQPVLASGVAEAPGEVARRPVHGSRMRDAGIPSARSTTRSRGSTVATPPSRTSPRSARATTK